jgi:hypothetical protein
MKPELQRIEAALNQLGKEPSASPASVASVSDAPGLPLVSSSSSISFRVGANAEMHTETYTSDPLSREEALLSAYLAPEVAESRPTCLNQNLPLSLEASKAPALPKLELSDFNTLPYDSEQVIQMIRTLEGIVAGWQAELQQIVQRIRTIEADGPAIHGWLEAQPLDATPSDVSVLRYGDVNELMAYVDEMCQPVSPTTPKSRYNLCGYNTHGQIWSRPCHPDELSSISMAIARYQTLSQLRERQQSLERRLGAIAMQTMQMYQQYAGSGLTG